MSYEDFTKALLKRDWSNLAFCGRPVTIWAALLAGCLMISSCTTRKPITYNTQKLYDEAISVQPSWQAELSVAGKRSPLIGAAGGGLIGSVLTVPNPQSSSGKFTSQESAFLGAVLGYGIGFVVREVVRPQKNQRSWISANEEEEWLRKFNQQKKRNYALAHYQADKNKLYLAPANKLDAFLSWEAQNNSMKRPNDPSKFKIVSIEIQDSPNKNGIIEAGESAVLTIEVQNQDALVLDRPELSVTLEGHSEGLRLEQGFRFSSRILPGETATFTYEIPPAISLKEGQLNCHAKLTVERKAIEARSAPITRASFFKKVPFLPPSTASAADRKRVEALEPLFGSKPAQYAKTARAIEEGVAAGDEKAKMWKAVLMIERSLVFPEYSDGSPQELAGEAIWSIEEQASQNDLEAIFLLARAYQHGIGKAENKALAAALMQIAADEGYLPAMVGICTDHLQAGKPSAQIVGAVQKAVDRGSNYARFFLGQIHHYGINGKQDPQKALSHYRAVQQLGIFEAFHLEGNGFADGTLGVPDAKASRAAFERAAKMGDATAMATLAELYYTGMKGHPKDFKQVEYWATAAAEAGNPEGMFRLSALYLTDEELGYGNIPAGTYWLKKAAVLGYGKAAKSLGYLYRSPELNILEESKVLSRFWTIEASLRGEKVEKLGSNYSPAQGFFENFSVKERVEVREYYGGRTETRSHFNPAADMVDALAGMWLQGLFSRGDSYKGAELVYEKDNNKVYAATFNSFIAPPIQLRAGQKVTIEGRGRVKLGMFAGAFNANGTNDPMARNYNIVPQFNHGCLMMRIGEDGPWEFVGTKKTFTAQRSGTLYLAVNDRDYGNNEDFFDVKITVTD